MLIDIKQAYEEMVLIRHFEEEVERQYMRAQIGGYCHLCSGQEASTVGVVHAMAPDDILIGSYRTHGLAIAKGIAPQYVMAELFGRVDGCAHGRGGSMHLLDTEHKFYGGWGIVAGQLPIAAGLALAKRNLDADDVIVCELGDAATNMGAWHESLNLAAIWKLPVVFVVFNNQYGMGTKVSYASGEPELHKRGCAYRMQGEVVDGQDIKQVGIVAHELIQQVRATKEPVILECLTYRYRGHSVADPGLAYRTKEEVAAWKEKDPILLAATMLKQEGLLTAEDEKKIDTAALATVSNAVSFAAGSPEPADNTLREFVYGDTNTAAQFARMNPGSPFGEDIYGVDGV